jgi:hypothetical protein
MNMLCYRMLCDVQSYCLGRGFYIKYDNKIVHSVCGTAVSLLHRCILSSFHLSVS